MASKIEELRIIVEATELLSLLNQRFGINRLEKVTGISKSVLSHYISGRRIPSLGKARLIIERILNSLPPGRVALNLIDEAYADIGEVVTDPLVLKLASLWVMQRYQGRVRKVLAAETAGVPLATSIAIGLGAELVLARRLRENPRREYVQAVGGEPPFNLKVFYIPKGFLRKGDEVLLIDDLARTGATLEALARAVAAAGARSIAAYVLVALGSEWRKRLIGLVDEAWAGIEIA